MGVTQIGEALGMYKSTVYRTLATLEQKEFVQQNQDNGKYWLGIKLYALGMLVRDKMSLQKISYPHAKALSERFKEVVHISVLDKSAEQYPRHIMIDKIESSQVLSPTPPIGSSSPCHCAAVGKCLLAYCSDGYIQRFIGHELPKFTKNTITDWDELLIELANIRSRGYSLDAEELEIGLTCVAAPIINRNGELIAALSLSGPTSRVQSDRFEEIVEHVQLTTKMLSTLI